MKIFIDYDTTLINLIDPWIKWINEKYQVSLQTDDINRWYYLGDVFGAEANDFWKSEKYNHYTDRDVYKPYNGAVDFFHTVQNIFGRENVYIISSSRNHHIAEKIEHAKYYFSIDPSNFISVKDKKYVLTKNGILIDDYPLHVMEHIHYNNHPGIVFNYENRFGWSKESNYLLDPTLSDFLEVVQNKKFSIKTSYEEVLYLLNNNRGNQNGKL